MTKEHVQHYADAIVWYFTPRNMEEVNADMGNNTYSHKLEDLHSFIMSFTNDVDTAIKEEIACAARQKLITAYNSLGEVEHREKLMPASVA